IAFAIILALPALWPQVDLFLSGQFYNAEKGFFLSNNFVVGTLHFVAYYGARGLGVVFLIFSLVAFVRHRNILLDAKAWLFMLLALLIGPGLVANVGFKDHWGRERPREIVEFGGNKKFSPALTPRFDNSRSNGSFVSGDGAFGFFLPAFAYVVPRRLSRRTFWSGMAAGVAFGLSRLVSGAHFFSDNVYAAFFMLVVCAGIYTAMYGLSETRARWKSFFMRSTCV
ncbi:MAG: phosphatase PAP2 family protein, partial [Bdellovibrionales bacterium]